MNKRVSSRAVIIVDNKLVVLFRKREKDGKMIEYYSLPGGGLEEGETIEESVIREVKEEYGVDIKLLGYLGRREDEISIQYYFHAEIINGTPKLGGEELERLSDKNYYEIRYLDISDLDNEPIYEKEKIKNAINKKYIPFE